MASLSLNKNDYTYMIGGLLVGAIAGGAIGNATAKGDKFDTAVSKWQNAHKNSDGTVGDKDKAEKAIKMQYALRGAGVGLLVGAVGGLAMSKTMMKGKVAAYRAAYSRSSSSGSDAGSGASTLWRR